MSQGTELVCVGRKEKNMAQSVEAMRGPHSCQKEKKMSCLSSPRKNATEMLDVKRKRFQFERPG